MTNYDLPAALKKYRLDHNLSLSQMGKKLNMSKSAYYRLEKGIRKPYHDELVDIIQKLQLNVDPKDVPSIPKPDPKWYGSRKLLWVIPILIATFFQSLLFEMRGIREGFGEEAIAAGKHVPPMFVIGAVFCAIFWYFWRPEWPKRKPTLLEVKYGAAWAATFLILFFHEEWVIPLIRWTGLYMVGKTAGLWIALLVNATMLAFCWWGFKKTIFFITRNTLSKR
ncbi:helix-turn-helix transcriptional regulator [Daejeonella sp.]|uniref:helix-turn-helix domain-containing protein n=1 Tax=Daejeonella sp. TaxID=2805397 RepID=UPI0030BB135D